MVENREINGTDEIGLVTPTQGRKQRQGMERRDEIFLRNKVYRVLSHLVLSIVVLLTH